LVTQPWKRRILQTMGLHEGSLPLGQAAGPRRARALWGKTSPFPKSFSIVAEKSVSDNMLDLKI